MGAGGVLDRELVQAEQLSRLVHLLIGGLVQSNPDELARAVAGALRGFGELLRPLVLAGPVAIVGAVDDHRRVVFHPALGSSCP